jgi:hypothetical protein
MIANKEEEAIFEDLIRQDFRCRDKVIMRAKMIHEKAACLAYRAKENSDHPTCAENATGVRQYEEKGMLLDQGAQHLQHLLTKTLEAYLINAVKKRKMSTLTQESSTLCRGTSRSTSTDSSFGSDSSFDSGTTFHSATSFCSNASIRSSASTRSSASFRSSASTRSGSGADARTTTRPAPPARQIPAAHLPQPASATSLPPLTRSDGNGRLREGSTGE